MSMVSDDLGVLGDLAIALGLFDEDGDPNPAWFSSPDESLTSMMANDVQREALISFVDEVLGGADRDTDASGTVWLPIVEVDGLTVSVTIAETSAGIDLGIGLVARTTDPTSTSTLAVPFFRAHRTDGPAVPNPMLLGSADGTIRASTSITIDAGPAVPGEARLGAIGIDVELPTSTSGPFEPVFGLSLSGFQLPGATEPRDIRVSADGADDLDDAVLDLVLSLVRSAADTAAPSSPIGAVAGLLGLGVGDVVPDFPIAEIATDGVAALSTWLRGVLTDSASLDDWVGHLADFLGGTATGGSIAFQLDPASSAEITVGIVVDTGPSGNARLTPRLAVELGTAGARVEAAADLAQIDLVTGSAVAFPQLGVWAAFGAPSAPVLDVTGTPDAEADTLRIGVALDADRRLTFVLALDQVALGSETYPVLDLTSPDAVMAAVGTTIEQFADDLLGNLGDALAVARSLLGLTPPAGITPVSLADLVTDPLAALAVYWREVITTAATVDGAMTALLGDLRDAIADAGSAVASVKGTGSELDPWRIDLIGALQLRVWAIGDELSVGVGLVTSVDTLGERCTVIETTFAATIATIDLADRTASLLPGCHAALLGRERGVDPPRVSLPLPGELGGTALVAGGVGVRLGWSPDHGIDASVEAPDLRLVTPDAEVPITIPTIAADGTVQLGAEGWDGVQALVGSLGDLLGGTLGEVVEVLGWTTEQLQTGADRGWSTTLRLADLVTSPEPAIAEWLASAVFDDAHDRVFGLLADLAGGVGPNRGLVEGVGHPDDPFRIELGPGVPAVSAWFPPHGPEPRAVSAPGALQRWTPGQPPLSSRSLQEALIAEAGIDPEVRALIEGRFIAASLDALLTRWSGGDGRIVPPSGAADGIDVVTERLAVGQLADHLSLRRLIGRTPSTTVHVSLDGEAWPDIGSSRRVDLTAPHLTADMFAAPAADTGDWFVALGTRAACAADSSSDGTAEQAARLAVVLEALATVSSDIAVVASAGAGHAARVAAEASSAVTDLVTLGTPLSPISLTALVNQPAADGVRLLHRLLPDEQRREDDDLALGRALVASLIELTTLSDPGAELRLPVDLPPSPRASLNVVAVFGELRKQQVGRAITAIVAAGLAQRARERALASPPSDPTGMCAGIRFAVDPVTDGVVSVSGDALLSLFEYVPGVGVDRTPRLRVRMRLGDPLGWLVSTPDMDVRAVSADIAIPLDGVSRGTATVTIHDARVFDQSWEALVLGDAASSVLPEARVLLAAAFQRLHADVGAARAAATTALLQAIGVLDAAGGVVSDAIDQLIHDAGGLLRDRLTAGTDAIEAALASLLGPLADSIDLDARSVRLVAGADDAGRYGWSSDVTVAPSGIVGSVRIGRGAIESPASNPVGGVGLVIDLDTSATESLGASLHWYRPGGAVDDIELWPSPDPLAIARSVADAAPSLGGQLALEVLRRADDGARPVVDAALDALGLLNGVAGSAGATVRPIVGLLADPAEWLRSTASLAAEPARVQSLFDALRPLLGLSGTPGAPLTFASGVGLAVSGASGGVRLALTVDPTSWVAPPGGGGRLSGGLSATLDIGLVGSPVVGLGAHVGLAGAAAGRQAVHVSLGGSGTSVFLRPTAGSDIVLVPFAGFGALAGTAAAALPYALDKMAEIPGDVGSTVGLIGDALDLRTGTPQQFDADRLHDWALDPVSSLVGALPSIVSTGLDTIAPLLDSSLPAAVSVSATTDQVTVSVGDFSLVWNVTLGRFALSGDGLPAPGVDEVSFTLAATSVGLEEVTATIGPATIDAGGVEVRPFVTVAAGLRPAGGRRVAVGLAADDTHRFAARWLLDTEEFDLVASIGEFSTSVDSTDAAEVALVIVDVIADLVAAVALAQQSVDDLLETPLGALTVRDLVTGVLLDPADPTQLIEGLFDVDELLDRFRTLLGNLGGLGISLNIDGFTLSFVVDDGVVGVQVGLAERFALVEGDISLWLENDDSWIDDNAAGDGGLFVGLVSAGSFVFAPSCRVNGLGLRIGSLSGPLIDSFITLDSVALHVFAAIDGTGAHSGGVQIQLANLAVPAGGTGGENSIASGIMSDTGPTPPQPAFSPALAVQKHRSAAVSVSLRAGDGDGPWWIAIQSGFGPLYLEQVGFGTEVASGQLTSISLLMDGSVSMFGLTCAVDDLSITYFVSNGDVFDAQSWAVDLAGLAVSADMAGVAISGGLLKQNTAGGTEYLGMLLGRFGVYGITIYGGYSESVADGQAFTSFFAVGAINGPIGGPPAFFLTGIGGGFGINRELIVPTDLSDFGDYPLIQALDIAASPADPMTQLRELGEHFPAKNSSFWFAAGLSFNSFALVDGIAVVAVEVGDGLDINLLGLARMALPRPEAALVSIEVALLVRFSSSEGVLWVQGQLTDNSWILYPDIKLTGGFAFVIWFSGEHRGEFVLTLGGYHPDFSRDGYPVVPRIGLSWIIGSSIVIEAGGYFALTSEALMAGGDFRAAAEFGPAWADVSFGAHGIVYFDPFRYQINAYARVSAGVTVDLWIFGEVTISVSIGARIDVTGPEFYAKVTFEVGPVELTVDFGGSDESQLNYLSGSAFVDKYLDPADGGSGALAHTAMTAFGALPSKGEESTPDGTSGRPFVVVVEFGLTFTTTIPTTTVERISGTANARDAHAPSNTLGVAPMGPQSVDPMLSLGWRRAGISLTFPFESVARAFGSFPSGVWGPPQDMDNRKVPKAEMIEALNELDLIALADPSGGGPEIPYHQVEIGDRKPLPFSRRVADVNRLKNGSVVVAGKVDAPVTVSEAFASASAFLAQTASPTSLAALRGERQAPPRLGTLTEGLDIDAITIIPDVAARPPGKFYDHFVDPPVAVGLLSGALADIRSTTPATTTVEDSARLWRTAPPTMASVESSRSRSIAARLLVTDVPAVSTRGRDANTSARRRPTVIGALDAPPTSVAHAPTAIVARAGGSGSDELAGFTAGLIGGRVRQRVQFDGTRRAAAPTARATLRAGQTVVLKMPNASADVGSDDRPQLGVTGSLARIVVLAPGGGVLRDEVLDGSATGPASRRAKNSVSVDRGAERIVATGLGQRSSTPLAAGLDGWHGGMQMPYVGWSTAIGPGCTVRTLGEPITQHRERRDAGWIEGAELTRGVSTVTTRFADPISTVVIVIDDPAAFGDPVSGRQLLLGLDGAVRATDGGDVDRPPVVLAMENRSVLAYEVVQTGSGPVSVTIASELGWSLAGVMGTSALTAEGAIALISARGLDVAIRPSAVGSDGVARLSWKGTTRTARDRKLATELASRRPGVRLAAAQRARTKDD